MLSLYLDYLVRYVSKNSVLSLFVVNMAAKLSMGEQWTNFKAEHGKQYDDEEDARRFAIFQSNVTRIEEHNKKYDAGETTYKQGINKFADLTPEELKKYTGLRMPPKGDDANAPTAL